MRKYLGPIEFADMQREFRQYGYDPYNSADDTEHWSRYKDAEIVFTREQMEHGCRAAVANFLANDPAEMVDMHRRLPQ